MSILAAASITTHFIMYPAFVQPGAVVETIIDKGITVEIIVSCTDGAGILQYAKPERQFCTPDHTCYPTLQAAIHRLCR